MEVRPVHVFAADVEDREWLAVDLDSNLIGLLGDRDLRRGRHRRNDDAGGHESGTEAV
jgi:hypothetical protein